MRRNGSIAGALISKPCGDLGNELIDHLDKVAPPAASESRKPELEKLVSLKR